MPPVVIAGYIALISDIGMLALAPHVASAGRLMFTAAAKLHYRPRRSIVFLFLYSRFLIRIRDGF